MQPRSRCSYCAPIAHERWRIVMRDRRKLLHGARTRLVLLGLAGMVAVAAAALVREYRSSGSSSTLTPAKVKREFAARGLVLEADPSGGLAPGSHAHLVGPVLSNRQHAARQGVITVTVLRSAAEAKGLLTRFQAAWDPDARSVCGSTDYGMWQARNVVASFTSCDYLDGAAREATAPADAALASAMADING
jgi:hypothetical protein